MSRSNKTQPQTLSALMPGVKIQNKKIIVNVSTSNETVIFNIGGTHFETYKSTLQKLPNTLLSDNNFLKKYYRHDKAEYFFDRDPEVFKSILQYLRTGELHLPSSTCGSSIKNELEFWGVEDAIIEDCCWLNYNSWAQTLSSLQKLDEDRQLSMGSIRHKHTLHETRWQRIKNYGWEFLNNPHWTIGSKIYGGVSVLFVFLSIFSYVAQTHEYFQMDPGKEIGRGYADYETNVSVMYLNTPTNTTSLNIPAPSPPLVHPLVHPVLFVIDCVCFTFFLLEMVTRFICCPDKLRFFFRPMNVIDFLSLLPDIVAFCALWSLGYPPADNHLATFIYLFRIMRVFRIFRLMRFFPGLWLLFYTLKASINELLLMLIFVISGMLVFSSLIYYAEERENFPSIPDAFWWAIITMTTVGYGDVSPRTNWGYLVGAMTAISGLLLIGFTVPVLVNNFILYYNHTQCALEREKRNEARYQLRKRKERISRIMSDKYYEPVNTKE